MCIAHNINIDVDASRHLADPNPRSGTRCSHDHSELRRVSEIQQAAARRGQRRHRDRGQGAPGDRRQFTDYSKKAFAASSAVVEKLLGAKSVETAIQIQTEYAKSAYEGFVAQASKINEIYVKLATEAFKPVETAFAEAQGK